MLPIRLHPCSPKIVQVIGLKCKALVNFSVYYEVILYVTAPVVMQGAQAELLDF